MNTLRISCFLKFGQEKHILDLYENGTIFMNPIEYFRKFEDEKLRGDDYEGTYKLTQLPENTPLTLFPNDSKEKIQLKVVKGKLREHYTSIKGNIYCLYAITPKMLKNNIAFKIDAKNKKFGTHFLATFETRMFYNKIIEQVKKKNYEYRSHLVDYYDKENYNGDLTLFDKPKEYSYQNEFRILIRNEKIEPIVLNIGRMKDYARVFNVNVIDELEIVKS